MAAAVSVLALACDATVDDPVPAATFGSGADSGSGATPLTTGADDDGDGDDAADDSSVMGQDGGSDETTGTTGFEPGATGTSSGGEADDLGPGSSSGEPESESSGGPPPLDPCATAMYGDGPYCGQSLGGTADTLYVCTGGVTSSMTPCDFGCAVCDPFTADVCKAMAGQSDESACG